MSGIILGSTCPYRLMFLWDQCIKLTTHSHMEQWRFTFIYPLHLHGVMLDHRDMFIDIFDDNNNNNNNKIIIIIIIMI
jgi:hypothetical protein